MFTVGRCILHLQSVKLSGLELLPVPLCLANLRGRHFPPLSFLHHHDISQLCLLGPKGTNGFVQGQGIAHIEVVDNALKSRKGIAGYDGTKFDQMRIVVGQI